MKTIEVLRELQTQIEEPCRVALVVGDELNEAEAVPAGMTTLTVIVRGRFLGWLVEDDEWERPDLVADLLQDIEKSLARESFDPPPAWRTHIGVDPGAEEGARPALFLIDPQRPDHAIIYRKFEPGLEPPETGSAAEAGYSLADVRYCINDRWYAMSIASGELEEITDPEVIARLEAEAREAGWLLND